MLIVVMVICLVVVMLVVVVVVVEWMMSRVACIGYDAKFVIIRGPGLFVVPGSWSVHTCTGFRFDYHGTGTCIYCECELKDGKNLIIFPYSNTNINTMHYRCIMRRLSPVVVRAKLINKNRSIVGYHHSSVVRQAEVDNISNSISNSISDSSDSSNEMLRSEGFTYSDSKKGTPMSISTKLPQRWHPSNEMLDYARSLVHEADAHAKDCELKQALSLYQKAVEVLKKCPEIKMELARIQNKIGVLHFQEDRLDDALVAFKEVLSSLDRTEAARGVVLKNIAEIYRKEQNVDKALKYYQDAIGYFSDSSYKQETDSVSSSQFDDVYSNVCIVYREKD